MSFTQQRHKPQSELERPREMVLALPPMRSSVNLSRIVRAAGVCGIRRVIACGSVKVDSKIARNAVEQVAVESPRSLLPALKKLKGAGFRLVGLEQVTNSRSLYDYTFARRTALVIGHERDGLSQGVLQSMDDVVEIPVYGLPYSHNAATAACIAMYEYCRQFPSG